MKYTAEEVREWAAFAQAQGKLYAPMKGAHEPWEKLEAMLTAYADLLERIKADEGAANKLVVPVAWMCETVNGYKVFNAEGPSFPCNVGVVSELFTHPPAQAAQPVDIEEIRKVIAHLRSFRSNTPPTWAHLDDAADKLEAALPESKP